MNDILNGVSKINYGTKIRMKSREKQINYLRTFFSPSMYAKFKRAMEYPIEDSTITERIFNNAKRCGKTEEMMYNFLKSSYN